MRIIEKGKVLKPSENVALLEKDDVNKLGKIKGIQLVDNKTPLIPDENGTITIPYAEPSVVNIVFLENVIAQKKCPDNIFIKNPTEFNVVVTAVITVKLEAGSRSIVLKIRLKNSLSPISEDLSMVANYLEVQTEDGTVVWDGTLIQTDHKINLIEYLNQDVYIYLKWHDQLHGIPGYTSLTINNITEYLTAGASANYTVATNVYTDGAPGLIKRSELDKMFSYINQNFTTPDGTLITSDSNSDLTIPWVRLSENRFAILSPNTLKKEHIVNNGEPGFIIINPLPGKKDIDFSAGIIIDLEEEHIKLQTNRNSGLSPNVVLNETGLVYENQNNIDWTTNVIPSANQILNKLPDGKTIKAVKGQLALPFMDVGTSNYGLSYIQTKTIDDAGNEAYITQEVTKYGEAKIMFNIWDGNTDDNVSLYKEIGKGGSVLQSQGLKAIDWTRVNYEEGYIPTVKDIKNLPDNTTIKLNSKGKLEAISSGGDSFFEETKMFNQRDLTFKPDSGDFDGVYLPIKKVDGEYQGGLCLNVMGQMSCMIQPLKDGSSAAISVNMDERDNSAWASFQNISEIWAPELKVRDPEVYKDYLINGWILTNYLEDKISIDNNSIIRNDKSQLSVNKEAIDSSIIYISEKACLADIAKNLTSSSLIKTIVWNFKATAAQIKENDLNGYILLETTCKQNENTYTYPIFGVSLHISKKNEDDITFYYDCQIREQTEDTEFRDEIHFDLINGTPETKYSIGDSSETALFLQYHVSITYDETGELSGRLEYSFEDNVYRNCKYWNTFSAQAYGDWYKTCIPTGVLEERSGLMWPSDSLTKHDVLNIIQDTNLEYWGTLQTRSEFMVWGDFYVYSPINARYRVDFNNDDDEDLIPRCKDIKDYVDSKNKEQENKIEALQNEIAELKALVASLAKPKRKRAPKTQNENKIVSLD